MQFHSHQIYAVHFVRSIFIVCTINLINLLTFYRQLISSLSTIQSSDSDKFNDGWAEAPSKGNWLNNTPCSWFSWHSLIILKPIKSINDHKCILIVMYSITCQFCVHDINDIDNSFIRSSERKLNRSMTNEFRFFFFWLLEYLHFICSHKIIQNISMFNATNTWIEQFLLTHLFP